MNLLELLNNGGAPSSEQIIESLFPNVWVFLAHLIATGIIIFIVYKFVWKIFNESQKKKSDFIESEIQSAIESRANAEKAYQKAQEILMQATNESTHYIENAKNEGYRIREEMKTQAEQLSDKIRNDAKNDIKNMESEMRKNIKEEIIDVAFIAAEKLLKKNVDNADNQRLVSDIVDTLQKTGTRNVQ